MLLKIKLAFARVWPITIKQFNIGLAEQTKRLETVLNVERGLKQQTEVLQGQTNALTELAQSQTNALSELMQKQTEAMTELMCKQTEMLAEMLQKQTEALTGVIRQLETLQGENVDKLQKNVHGMQLQLVTQLDAIRDVQEQLPRQQDIWEGVHTVKQMLPMLEGNMKEISKLKANLNDSNDYVKEILWAETFESATKNSTWLLDKAFSPGRWAVGYPFLYAMFRLLNETKPKRILELGLGQSTKMLAQYVMKQDGAEHIVVEANQAWVDFFTKDFRLPACSKIELCEMEMIDFRDAKQVRVYKDLPQRLAGKKFDFIMIDAPMGGDMKQYSRIDILRMLPECLEENFVILFDDCQRVGEQHTVAEIENCLKQSRILYKKGKYSGKKECVIICAEALGFLTTM